MLQLVAGRTGQEYNTRKHRKGAFWEDRYHATAIESGTHLQRCLVYVDLNMVRAGVVKHPGAWNHGGYHEIQGNRRRNTVIDLNALVDALDLSSVEHLRVAHRDWVTTALREEDLPREEIWSQSVAVGSIEFTQRTQQALGIQGRNRELAQADGLCVLREAEADYGTVFGAENRPIASINQHLWDVS